MLFKSRRQRKFKPGDKVVYTNEYGVCWGVRTIVGFGYRGPVACYYYEPSQSPWFPVEECRFQLATDEDLAAQERKDITYFQTMYGFPTTYEQRAALLETDPFLGEA